MTVCPSGYILRLWNWLPIPCLHWILPFFPPPKVTCKETVFMQPCFTSFSPIEWSPKSFRAYKTCLFFPLNIHDIPQTCSPVECFTSLPSGPFQEPKKHTTESHTLLKLWRWMNAYWTPVIQSMCLISVRGIYSYLTPCFFYINIFSCLWLGFTPSFYSNYILEKKTI